MLRRSAWILVACCLPSCARAQGTTTTTTTITWRLAGSYGPAIFHTASLQRFAADVDRATRGRLKIEVTADRKPPQIVPAVEAGSVEAGEVLMSSLSDQPALRILGADGVPFIVRSYEDAARLWKHQRPAVEAALARRGLTVLYACPWPAQGLYTTRPVRSVGDIAGARMRTYNPTTVGIARLVGAAPVDLPTSELPEAFAAGRIDTMITSAVTGVDSKAWGFAKFFYTVKAWYPKNIVVVNTARFEALDPTTRDQVRLAATAAEQRCWQLSAAASERANTELAAHGMKVEAPSFVFRSELDRLGERFSREWASATGTDASQVLLGYFSDPGR